MRTLPGNPDWYFMVGYADRPFRTVVWVLPIPALVADLLSLATSLHALRRSLKVVENADRGSNRGELLEDAERLVTDFPSG